MQFGRLRPSAHWGTDGPIPFIVHPADSSMSQVFAFGERRAEFPIPVLNERAVRAAAGIVFFFAIVSFMNAWLIGNFQPTRVFGVAFLIDFTIRIFVNPKFAPSLILGVCETAPERDVDGGWVHARVALGFVGVIGAWASHVIANDPDALAATPASAAPATASTVDAAEAERCKVPDFAKAIGHEEKWKLHNHCQ